MLEINMDDVIAVVRSIQTELKDLARQYGETIGDMAHEMQVSGWYAPSINNHRSAFGGRNLEYFSEDPVLTAGLATEQVLGAADRGVYAFTKHFALNEQETERNGQLCTWSNEQAIRGYADIMLASTETTNHVTDHSATSVIAMRRAAHNILYTAVNSWRYADGEPADPMPAWQIAMIMADVVLGVALVGLEAIAIRRQPISSGCRLIHTRSRSRNRCRADTE